ncbi:DUF1848 domain-containing protein [Hungatella hathewayi]|uniref:DUF1848 domain-containing protein n=1 Tax=Hungatella hathewayi TaxID=154046 RepID=UPI0021099E57|nr:DUF1848 domain-containing protein [Hungatella hathewayi]MCQ5384582.1 DUF1848 domain-containing protein [Hungatella hathewayi]
MILSVSRRTDIPQYYSDWFFNRMKEGFLYVKNPMNSHQVSRIELSPDLVDLVVFWTKNPEPMMKRIDELGEIPYYIQFTLTGYGRGMEPGLADKRELIRIFRETAETAGRNRMVWRYDPVLLNERYPAEYHFRAFEAIAEGICGCTDKVVISFLDCYGKTKRNMRGIPLETPDTETMKRMGETFVKTAERFGMRVESCAEAVDLSDVGIRHGSCIDPAMAEQILGVPIHVKKDKNQRPVCGCVESVETGAYDTCLCGCKYCYANDSEEAVKRRRAVYDADSPLLCGTVEEGDRITVRRTARIRSGE